MKANRRFGGAVLGACALLVSCLAYAVALKDMSLRNVYPRRQNLKIRTMLSIVMIREGHINVLYLVIHGVLRG